MRLLGRVIELRDGGETHIVPGLIVGQQMTQAMRDEVTQTMRRLSDRGFVSLEGRAGLWFATPTAAGEEAHARFEARRGSKVHRRRHVRTRYLHWIDDHADADGWAIADAFLDSGTHWHGDAITAADLHEAGAWLLGKALITGPMVDQRADPARVRLTPEGLDVIERGIDLSTLGQEAAPATSTTSYITNVTGSAMVSQGGTGVTQTQHIGGDVGELARVMVVAIELLRPSLPETVADEFAEHAEALRAEAARGGDADEGRTRGVLARIAGGLAGGAATGAGEAAVLALSTLAAAMLGGA